MYCNKCGTKNDNNMHFCKECGNELNSNNNELLLHNKKRNFKYIITIILVLIFGLVIGLTIGNTFLGKKSNDSIVNNQKNENLLENDNKDLESYIELNNENNINTKVIEQESDLNRELPKINNLESMKQFSLILSTLAYRGFDMPDLGISNSGSLSLIKIAIYFNQEFEPNTVFCFSKKHISDKIYEWFDIENISISKTGNIDSWILNNYYCMGQGFGGGVFAEYELNETSYQEDKLYVYKYEYYIPDTKQTTEITVKFKKVQDLYKVHSIYTRHI